MSLLGKAGEDHGIMAKNQQGIIVRREALKISKKS